jgi:hypothetical protein
VQPRTSLPSDSVDALIVRLIHREVDASSEDVARIVDRIATAPFNRHPMRVSVRDRGLAYGGLAIGRTADPLLFHLVKRVCVEEQWSHGTTADEYLGDLRGAARHAHARVVVFERFGYRLAATMSPTADVVPVQRRGPNWLPSLLVVYSAGHGNLRTGYMFSDTSELDLPEAIRWLT